MKQRIIISIVIIAIILFLAFSSLKFLIKDAKYSVYKNSCEVVYHQTSDRNIVLRIDDIQAYYLRDIQIRMIQDALRMNRTLSLAVIPVGLLDDKELSRFLKENRCSLEIGLHGYDNTDFEFLDISYKEANNKIKKGLKILKEIEPKVITFIPPNNEISEQGRRAVYNNGLKIISSGFENREFGFSVSTYDWKNHAFTDYKEILEGCENELNKNETCIIMIHPQDYTKNNELDSEKYDEYLTLLNKIDELNATIVTFRDLYYRDLENSGIIELKK